MLLAEKISAKKYSDTFHWSPILKRIDNEVRYWRLRLKRAKSIHASEYTLIKAAEAANIQVEDTPLQTTAIITKLQDAHKHLRDHQRQHIELRKNHLESLAAARVITARQSLLSNPDLMKRATEKEIKRIQRNERSRRSHQSIRRYLRPKETIGGLARVDVPSDRNADPKTWTGPWESISDPEGIAIQVCQANAKQYHQACETPFATEPLLSYIGINGDGPGAEAILRGEQPSPAILSQLLPETQAILRTIASMPPQSEFPSDNTNFTTEQFRALYKVIPENISSPPPADMWATTRP
jgi:hypothetical protein